MLVGVKDEPGSPQTTENRQKKRMFVGGVTR